MPSPPRRVRGKVRVGHPRFGEKTISRERLQAAEAGGWYRIAEPRPRRRRRTQSSAQSDSSPSASTTATDPASPDDVKEQS